MTRNWRSAILLLVFCVIASRAEAQFPPQTKVAFHSTPDGTTGVIFEQVSFTTPTTLELSLGLYSVRLRKEGYTERIEHIAVYGDSAFFNFDMNAPQYSVNLLRLASEPRNITWGDHQIRFLPNSSEDNDQNYLTLNFETMQFEPASKPLNQIVDPNMKEALNAASSIYVSPSRRYLSYVTKSTFFTVIADTKENRIFSTELPSSQLELSVIWSADERIAWIKKQSPTQAERFVIWSEETLNSFVFTEFETSAGIPVYVDKVLGRPLDNGLVLAWAQTETEQPVVWLVDLPTLVGAPIPVEGSLDAVFSADGTSILVASKRGIERLGIDLKIIENIDQEIVPLRNVVFVEFSSNGKYAVVVSNSTEAPQFWLYKLRE